MAQSRGYNGFSFRDLATEVGVKSASVHYHFPSKGDLGAALARRYTDRLMQMLGSPTGASEDSYALVKKYVAVFRGTLAQDGRMCLGGMLAVERDAVPPEVHAEINRFVELNVNWLTAVLSVGEGKDVATRQRRLRAQAIFAALEGAMLVARGTANIAAFDQICREFLRTGLLPSR